MSARKGNRHRLGCFDKDGNLRTAPSVLNSMTLPATWSLGFTDPFSSSTCHSASGAQFIRSWIWNPADVVLAWTNNRKRTLHAWRFPRPFFISHRYSIHVHKDPKAFCSSLIPSAKRTTAETLFPFAQYCRQLANLRMRTNWSLISS